MIKTDSFIQRTTSNFKKAWHCGYDIW